MAARHRVLNGPVILGTGKWVGSPITASRQTYQTICDDVVGDYGNDHNFSLSTTRFSGGLLSAGNPSLLSYFDSMPVAFSIGSPLTAPSPSSLSARIMSTTGPLTPRLYLPVSLFELKDIPLMLRHAGNLLHGLASRSGLDPMKEAGAATLAYQFGWKPLMQDIFKMAKFGDLVRKKQEELRKAASNRGIRRRISLDSNDVTSNGVETTWSTYGMFVGQRWSGSKSYKQWATMRWTIRDPSQMGKTPTYMESFKTALGLSKGHIPIEVWKAMPWSWAIDWFAGLSNTLQASHNMIYYKPSNICVMTYRKNEWTYDPYLSGGVSVTGGTAVGEWKSRTIVAPNPNVSLRLPFLDNFKLSIIGSLAAVRIAH